MAPKGVRLAPTIQSSLSSFFIVPPFHGSSAGVNGDRANKHGRAAPEGGGCKAPGVLRMLASLSLGFAVAAGSAVADDGAAGDEAVRFGLRVEIAQSDSLPVVSREWLGAQITEANRLFAPAGVAFENSDEATLPDAHRVMMTRRDRHRLAPRVGEDLVHVFVVESLANVDEPGFIQGVHWRSRLTGTYRHYVILSRIAGPSVLGHELGHFFGNPHSDVPGNIMSYTRGSGPPAFDRAQLRRIRRFRDRFLRTGELVRR